MQELLASVTRRASCNICGSGLTVRENLGVRRGICTKLTLSYTNPLCTGKEDAFCNPYVHSKALNSRFILAGRMCGRGSTGLETICGVMGLSPPVTSKSYSTHNSILQKFVHNVRVESCRSASEQLRRLQGADPGDVIDVTVTCDGTWSRRGCVAAFGVVVVLSWETGQVLDVTVLSKSCKDCKEAESTMGSESQEFLDWTEKHQDSCNSNYTGSSPTMEAEGASIFVFVVFYIFRRWSAWDTFKSASGEKLRDLKKKTFVDDSGQVRKIKWGAKGCLTDAVIESLMVYFGGAIRNFPGTWMECSELSGQCSTIQFPMMINMTISFACQDQTHGANSIVHSL